MRIVSTIEMHEIDRITSDHYGIPMTTLMENAGSSVARFILSAYPKAKNIGVLCGKGNNGGDGFVAARILKESGCSIEVMLLCDPHDLRGVAALMFEKLKQSKIEPRIVRVATDLESVDARRIFERDLIVDAILGTGFRPPVSDLYGAAIRKINAASSVIVAVDIPSGVVADEMSVKTQNDYSRADAVVTFTAPHLAHIFSPLTQGKGPTVIAQIGTPPEAVQSKLGLNLSSSTDFAQFLKARDVGSNKGSYGKVPFLSEESASTMTFPLGAKVTARSNSTGG
jgi:hydroxyethylthiazole kinase-like uncharacterized protein yjeF